ncbi:uncharacterized protein ISCGN_032026 [Ixodes scapularis]
MANTIQSNPCEVDFVAIYYERKGALVSRRTFGTFGKERQNMSETPMDTEKPSGGLTFLATYQAKPAKPQGHRCIALGCNSIRYGYDDAKLRYFRLPPDENRRNQWLTNCGREDLKSHPVKSLVTKVLCQLHFHDSQFMNAHNYQRLVWNALPTLFGSDTRKPEEFKPLVDAKAATQAQDHAYTAAGGGGADQRRYMLLCADLKRQLADKERQLELLQKYRDTMFDTVLRQARALPPDKQRSLVGSLLASLKPRPDAEVLQLLRQNALVGPELPPEATEPRVRVEVLLLSREHPGCALLGMGTHCALGRGLYQPPADFIHFGESWEAAAARATQQETGLPIQEPQVCSVVETLRPQDQFHCISIFMAAHVACPDPQPSPPEQATCASMQSVCSLTATAVLKGYPNRTCFFSNCHTGSFPSVPVGFGPGWRIKISMI